MSTKNLKLALIAALAMTAIACSDDDDKAAPAGNDVVPAEAPKPDCSALVGNWEVTETIKLNRDEIKAVTIGLNDEGGILFKLGEDQLSENDDVTFTLDGQARPVLYGSHVANGQCVEDNKLTFKLIKNGTGVSRSNGPNPETIAEEGYEFSVVGTDGDNASISIRILSARDPYANSGMKRAPEAAPTATEQ